MDFDETLDDFADDFDTVFNANLDTTNTPGTSVNNKSSVNAFEILSIDDVTLHVNNIVEEVTPILNVSFHLHSTLFSKFLFFADAITFLAR